MRNCFFFSLHLSRSRWKRSGEINEYQYLVVGAFFIVDSNRIIVDVVDSPCINASVKFLEKKEIKVRRELARKNKTITVTEGLNERLVEYFPTKAALARNR